jgi:hypothetical protein
MVASSLQARLLEDTVQRSWRQIVLCFSCDGHAVRLGTMLQLAMAASHRNLAPSIAPQQMQNVSHFHQMNVLPPGRAQPPPKLLRLP